MNLIKAKFFKNGEPSGRAYTYLSNEVVKVGDVVQLNENSTGVVVEINVPESEVEPFKDKLKTIIGKVPESQEHEVHEETEELEKEMEDM